MMISSIMPLRNDFHVTFDRTCMYWKVSQEYRCEVTYKITKAEAVGLAIEQARNGHVSLIIHGRDGRIQEVISYDKSRYPD